VGEHPLGGRVEKHGEGTKKRGNV
jgi:hypothetical protein